MTTTMKKLKPGDTIGILGGGQGQHAAELTAADDADRGLDGKRAHAASTGWAATASVCAAR